ncbi:MAG TPA: KEOPS complex subunit Cgi121 [Methanocorpusculum sp.]|nr:KEOPS complex subunit Cgi121 [Methanocorpusculum sp.]
MIIVSGKIDVKNVSETLAQINDIADSCGSSVVIFDAEKTAGIRHIESAVSHAERSFETKTNIARTFAMEVLVYASGQRQCSLASKFGLHPGENAVYAAVVDGKEEEAGKLLKAVVLEGDVPKADVRRLMREFDITEEELEIVGIDRIEELVIERCAMVDAWK